MATGRTISASFLTDRDKEVISLCGNISNVIMELIEDKEKKKDFYNNYGKVNESRDAGAGRGAGKLQRDAICTRGRGGRAPFSNRNLRWHPLVVSEDTLGYAEEIERIEVEGESESQTLYFVIKDEKNKEIRYSSDKVHELPRRFVALPKHWIPHIDRLKHWNDNMWTQNSCVIPALESCEWWNSVETYAVLAMAIAVEIYLLKFGNVYNSVVNILKTQRIDKSIKMPSKHFPNTEADIVKCPLCKVSITSNSANLPERERENVWQPEWRSTKREEGEEGSIQIMHIKPLIDRENRHNAKNVRYGHRWCNVSMTDHSLDETLDFMEYIVKAHNRSKK